MSSLKQPNGDDFPEASERNLADANALARAARYDGAAYLSGYVVECALKSLLLVEGAPAWGHSLNELSSQAAEASLLAGASTAKYVTLSVRGLSKAAIAGWSVTIRYRSPSMSAGDAWAWVGEARAIYTDTIASMILDGVIS